MVVAFKHMLLAVAAATIVAQAAWGAELVHLTDGSTRRGAVQGWDKEGLRLRVEMEGIRVETVIPNDRVARVERPSDGGGISFNRVPG